LFVRSALLTGALLITVFPTPLRAEPRAVVTNSPAREPKGESTQRQLPGALVIVGGGLLPEAVRDRFLELAGGKKARLVVIPTASARAHQTGVFKSFAYWRAQGVASAVLLHTLDRAKANDPQFIKPLTEATGVWLGGGDQARLASVYRGTAVERELRKVLGRGGVIGGTSAGASVMSTVMIVGGNPLPEVGDGLGLLPDVVIDQHFQNRNRLKRLLNVLRKHPECLGLGIDEQTAVIVKGHTGTILGNANVRVCLPPQGRDPERVEVLRAGQYIDLLTLQRAALSRTKAAPPAKASPEVIARPAEVKPGDGRHDTSMGH
jgi:cyanophycinase